MGIPDFPQKRSWLVPPRRRKVGSGPCGAHTHTHGRAAPRRHTCICPRMVAPSFVITTSPSPFWIILSIPLGPRLVRMASATAFAARMLAMRTSCVLLGWWGVSVRSCDGYSGRTCGWAGGRVVLCSLLSDAQRGSERGRRKERTAPREGALGGSPKARVTEREPKGTPQNCLPKQPNPTRFACSLRVAGGIPICLRRYAYRLLRRRSLGPAWRNESVWRGLIGAAVSWIQ